MSTGLAPAGASTDRALLRQLAGIHIKRYATHPLYLTGVAFLLLTATQMYEDGPKDWEGFTTPVVVAFFLGVLGVVVGYRLTATERRALDLLDAAPTDATARTLSLCAAVIVPVGTAAVWVVWRLATWAVWPMRQELLDGIGGWLPAIAAILAASVVAAAGGPLFGIMTARWVRFPGAGVLAAIVLLLPTWVLAGGMVEDDMYDNTLIRAIGSLAPYTLWPIVDYTDDIGQFVGIRDGSPFGHLLYTLGLCGLAVWAAVMKDARGDTRARWTRIGWLLGTLTVAGYLWAWLG